MPTPIVKPLCATRPWLPLGLISAAARLFCCSYIAEGHVNRVVAEPMAGSLPPAQVVSVRRAVVVSVNDMTPTKIGCIGSRLESAGNAGDACTRRRPEGVLPPPPTGPCL